MTSTEIGAEYAARAAWETTVVPGQENQTGLKSRPSRDLSAGSSRAVRNPLASTNGTSLNRKSSREAIGQSYSNSIEYPPPPRRIGEIGRKESSISKTGSEADSLLDLYGQSSTRSNSKVDLGDKRGYEKGYPEDMDPDEKWIHRDKLAKIESEELQAAGINLPSSGRSRTGNRRAASQDDANATQNGIDEMPDAKRLRAASPADEGLEQERMTWDLRSPEEIAADDERAAAHMYAHPVVRRSGSRIPVLSSSTPRTRRRNTNNAGDEDGLQSRSRANSHGSQVLLDEYDQTAADAPPTPAMVRPSSRNGLGTSPTKNGLTKLPSPSSNTATTTPSGNRKASAPVSGTKTAKTTNLKARSASSNAPNTATSPSTNRPVTRSGDDGTRPRTAVNRPEGDPPWLATMYKPDPRLPPDQQIIPTHARRVQQQQWTDDGAIPSTYDRDFSPLAIHTADGLKPPTPTQSPTKDNTELLPPPPPLSPSDPNERENTWPLKSLSPSPNLMPNGRPGTSGTDHGGYSTMPNIKKSPRMDSFGPQSPRMGGQPTSLNRIQQPIPPDEDEEKGRKKKGGCGCCIVM